MEEFKKNQFRNILIIDDDEDDCALIAETLHEIDGTIKCELLFNGREALNRIIDSENVPALIFLDLHMPIMNGLEVLKVLKADPELSHIPVVICTDSKLAIEMEECKKLGAAHFIMKPSSFVLTKFEIRNAMKVVSDSLVS